MSTLYSFTPEQEQLRSVLRDFLEANRSARSAYDSKANAPDRGLWAGLSELGATGLGIAEVDGGSGGTIIDQLVIAEELGRVVAPVGYVPAVLLGAALSAAKPTDDRSRWLAGIADGTILPGVHLDRGPLAYDCASADVLLVHTTDGPGIVDRPELVAQPSIDRTRPMCTVAEVDPERLDTSTTRSALNDLQRTLYAAEAVGVAAAVLDVTAAYTRDRKQFGLPIGTFQAVKHRLADMLVEVECARSAAYAAAWAINAGADATLPGHLAQAVATEAAIKVVSAAVQLHGGIGVTWEHDLHLYLRRAKALELAHGTPAWHYDQIAFALLGPSLEP